MIAIRDTEMPKYCNYWDAETRRWIECPIYKSCKYHTCNIDEKPSGCPLVEIVTCKECKHYENMLKAIDKNGDRWILHICKKYRKSVSEDWYCPDGEMRD
jgi:ssDNA-binding Zn-finger/Zn-ribbon topoisomerase 1